MEIEAVLHTFRWFVNSETNIETVSKALLVKTSELLQTNIESVSKALQVKPFERRGGEHIFFMGFFERIDAVLN